MKIKNCHFHRYKTKQELQILCSSHSDCLSKSLLSWVRFSALPCSNYLSPLLLFAVIVIGVYCSHCRSCCHQLNLWTGEVSDILRKHQDFCNFSSTPPPPRQWQNCSLWWPEGKWSKCSLSPLESLLTVRTWRPVFGETNCFEQGFINNHKKEK